MCRSRPRQQHLSLDPTSRLLIYPLPDRMLSCAHPLFLRAHQHHNAGTPLGKKAPIAPLVSLAPLAAPRPTRHLLSPPRATWFRRRAQAAQQQRGARRPGPVYFGKRPTSPKQKSPLSSSVPS